LPVRLNAVEVGRDEALLAFGPPLHGAGAVFCLSHKADLTEAAARFFAGFRHLDADAATLGLTRIAVMSVPNRGLGRALNDRMCRAAKRRA
jgi:L-threonylcarbamoyladenylate synthase